jgi:prepilin-type processing-associated H-X9-DG protein
MQVSTNDGGSWEFLKAANNMTGEFYFSYQHFLPLANDLAVPKILACPADTRQAATNFAALQNENLSYFAAGNPEFGNPSSLLTGDRNVSPVYGSVATVGTYRCLRWTEELHRFKGNVLFSDGHVDMLNDVFSITNRVAAAAPTTLHLPSVRPTAPAPGGGEGVPYEYAGGGPPAVRPFTPVIPVFTNRLGTNQTVTNWWVSGQRVRNSWLAFPDGNSGDAGGVSPAPASSPSPPLAAAPTAYRRVGEPAAAPGGLRGVYQQVKDRGGAVLRRAAVVVYDIPWYLLLLLIAALLELRRRIRARQKAIIRHPIASSAH